MYANICSLKRDWSIVWIFWINFVTCQLFKQQDLKRVYQCEKNIISSWKKAEKVDFWKLLDPLWGFKLKTVPRIHDPRISLLPFGTKNHEMWGPPVSFIENPSIAVLIYDWWIYKVQAKHCRIEKYLPLGPYWRP